MKKLRLKKWMYDFILGICMLIVVIVALIYSYVLESPRITIFLARPDVYMALWLFLLAVLSIVLILRALKHRRTPEGQAVSAPIWGGMAVFTIAVMLVYLLLLNKIGFLLDSVLMLWSLSLVYTFNIGSEKKNWKNKKIFLKEFVKTGLFSIITSVAVFYIFTQLLSSKLPTFTLF